MPNDSATGPLIRPIGLRNPEMMKDAKMHMRTVLTWFTVTFCPLSQRISIRVMQAAAQRHARARSAHPTKWKSPDNAARLDYAEQQFRMSLCINGAMQ